MVQSNSRVPALVQLHALRERLCTPELNQYHLFENWPLTCEAYTMSQIALLKELYNFSEHYHGGVEQYIRTGKALLDKNHQAEGDYKCLDIPSLLYKAPCLFSHSSELSMLEARGAALVKKTVFVLVAGGLGERLGYSGIKIALPVETATQRCYLEHYLSWVKTVAGVDAPVIIMTSDSTHEHTIRLLNELDLHMQDVHLLKQGTVLCFQDEAARLARGPDGRLLRKPHGHGDVHTLIYTCQDADPNDPGHYISVVDAWLKRGYEFICFFQDTNAVAIHTIPISLAISDRESLDLNFTCIPRKPKEAIGLLCHAQCTADSAARGVAGSGAVASSARVVWRTVNVEYNTFARLAPKLRDEGGDVAANGSEWSRFPGNANTLLIKLSRYAAKLHRFQGIVPEFINPKYADDSYAFKKPARLESLMQDFSLFFSEAEHDRVGGTVFSRFTFQPVKNSLKTAVSNVRQGIDAFCAATGEAGYYEFVRRRLRVIGIPLHYELQPLITVRKCLPIRLFPIITMDAVARGMGTLATLTKTFPIPEAIHISSTSALLIEGYVVVYSLDLDGVLRLIGPSTRNSAPLIVRNVRVRNKKWKAYSIAADIEDGNNDLSIHTCEIDEIRGFVLDKSPCKVLCTPAKL